ncbi:MAG: PorV/PorQ family protein [Elusimicrobiota bacterium]
MMGMRAGRKPSAPGPRERGRAGWSCRIAAAALFLAAPWARGSDFGSHAVGTAGSEFLNIDVDARGIAMGGAFSAVTADAYALYWNPAGLSSIPRISAAAMHNEYFAGIRMQHFTYAQRATDTSVFGAAIRYMDVGEITNTDINGNTIGTFHPRNYVYEVGWGQSITDLSDAEREVSMGIGGRYFHSDLVAHADGFSGDVGIQAHYTDVYLPYHFGLVLQNIGQGQKFDAVRDNLPFRARLGSSINPKPSVLVALEAVFPISNHPYGAAGVEVSLNPTDKLIAFLRGGFNSRSLFSGLDGLRGVTLGFGVKARDITFDYAFVPFGLLGNAHRFSVSWNLPAKHSRRLRPR